MSDVTLSKAVRTNLLSLQSTALLMEKTQQRLATGNKVNSALDNPSSFFTASSLNSRAADMSALIDGMANGIKTLEAADNGLKSITKTLESMQSTLRQARQDKSFQVEPFKVSSASSLVISGGTLGAEGAEIALPQPGPGTKAKVTSEFAYTGPARAGSTVGGARVEITWNATMNGAEDITVDDHAIDLTGVTGAEAIATAMQAELDEFALGAYLVSEDDGVISIERTDTSAASPVVNLGETAEVAGTAKFTFDPERMGHTIIVDNKSVTIEGDLASFAAALGAELGEGYTVTADAETDEISITANTAGASSTPQVAGGALTATAASATFEVDNTDAFALKIDGTEKLFAAGTTDAQIVAAFAADPDFPDKWTITQDGGKLQIVAATTGETDAPSVTASALASTGFTLATTDLQTLTIGEVTTSLIAGETQVNVIAKVNAELVDAASDYRLVANGAGKYAVVTLTAGEGAFDKDEIESTVTAQLTLVAENSDVAEDAAPLTSLNANPGLAAVTVTTQAGADGAAWKSYDAPVDRMTITYGAKYFTVDINYAANNADIAAGINQQLKEAGIAVTALFEDGKLSFEADAAEAKTLVISGTSIFNQSVNTGVAPQAALNATKAVDQFVELINRDFGTSIRASNDNGSLRLENLSTADMTVSVDEDGSGSQPATNKTIKGNSVRAGLASQFNELKDQLNKLSDDASFNGINLLRGDQLTITFNETGNSFMQIKAADTRGINSQTLNLEDLVGADFDLDADIDSLLSGIKLALNNVRSQASAFGSNLSIVQNRQDFTKNMINTLQTGASNLTLADMNEEAANLLALQTRQSLSSSALSMASQADQNILQLLR
jgi:flagellin-like hook-associated protein FlgL